MLKPNNISPVKTRLSIYKDNFNSKQLYSLLIKMVEIRVAESILASGRKNGLIKGPVHLSAGQEAIPAGVSFHLKSSDSIFGNHRSHGHLIALKTNMFNFFSEVLARETGCSGGNGGSMHLIDKSIGFEGAVPIVAGTVSLSLGAALSHKLDNKKQISVCYIGDGAIEEGVVHECLNIASLMNLPIIFIVENNFFASHMHITQRQTNLFTSRFAKANNINFQIADGNNVLEVSTKFEILIKNARTKNKPGFLEAFTYRHYGHVDWRDDVDVGINRSLNDLDLWKKRDPIISMFELIKKEKITTESLNKIFYKIESEYSMLWGKALQEKPPKISSLNKNILSKYD